MNRRKTTRPIETASLLVLLCFVLSGCASKEKVFSYESQRAHLMNELGLTEYRRGELKLAYTYFGKALRHAEATDNRAEAVRAHINLGQVLSELGEAAASIPHYHGALRIARDMDDDTALYNALEATGRYLFSMDRLDEAEKTFMEALDVAEDLESREKKALTLNDLGAVFREQGRIEKALEKFHYALVLFESMKGFSALDGRGSVSNNLAAVREEQGRYGEAWDHLTNSLACYQQLGNKEALVTCHLNMGRLLEVWGKTSDALLRYERAYGVAKEIPNPHRMEISLQHIVRLSEALKMPSLLEKYRKLLDELRRKYYGNSIPP